MACVSLKDTYAILAIPSTKVLVHTGAVDGQELERASSVIIQIEHDKGLCC